MALFCTDVKIFCVTTKSSGRSAWSGVWEGRWPTRVEEDRVVIVERRLLNRQIFVVRYLQFVERKNLHATLCPTG